MRLRVATPEGPGAHLLTGANNLLPRNTLGLPNDDGGSVFEYDKPSSLFEQFGDDRVTEVGRYLDGALETALRQAAG